MGGSSAAPIGAVEGAMIHGGSIRRDARLKTS